MRTILKGLLVSALMFFSFSCTPKIGFIRSSRILNQLQTKYFKEQKDNLSTNCCMKHNFIELKKAASWIRSLAQIDDHFGEDIYSWHTDGRYPFMLDRSWPEAMFTEYIPPDAEVERHQYTKPEFNLYEGALGQAKYVPLELVVDGRGLVEQLENLYKNKVTYFDGNSYYFIDKSKSPSDGEKVVFSICQCSRSLKQIDPTPREPVSCLSVAVQLGGQTWVRARPYLFRVGLSVPLMSMPGHGRVSREITIVSTPSKFSEVRLISDTEIRSKIHIKIENALMDLLRKPPFAMLVERYNNRSHAHSSFLEASSSGRKSPILQGDWREDIVIRIDVIDNNVEAGKFGVSIRIGFSMEVSKANTNRPQDWHRPESQQLERYEHFLMQFIQSQITEICEQSSWTHSPGHDVLSCKGP